MNNRKNYTSSGSRNFKPYNRSNSCPICNSTSGKCKEQYYEQVAKNGKVTPTIKTYCMDGTSGNGDPNYHYYGDTRNGSWGIYIPLSDYNEHRGQNNETSWVEAEEWKQREKAKRKAEIDRENQRKADTFPIADRDPVAKAILNQLTLYEIDRQDLLRRGFTPQQIKDIGFKSIDPFHKLTSPVNPRFPGVNVNGTQLNNGYTGGILIPVRTNTGEIVAFQIRNRDKKAKQRYKWLSSAWEKAEGTDRKNGSSPKLADLNLPLTHVYPQLLGAEATSKAIGLMEGTGAKPNLGAIKTGEQVIGAAGGQFRGSLGQFKNTLETWNAVVVKLYLDGDDLKKPEVVRRWTKIYNQLIDWGYIPKLMWSGKDIDELEDLTELRELSIDDLTKIPDPRPETIIELTASRKAYRTSQKFTANETQCNRYLNIDVNTIDFENNILGIKSALGTGKTELLIQISKKMNPIKTELFILGYRNNLLYQTCDRIPDLYHIGEESKILLSSDYNKSICHHSAGLVKEDTVSNKLLIIDECASVLDDMITSKLTGGRNKDGTDARQKRLEHIEKLIKNAYGIVIMDGYLTDRHVNFIKSIRQTSKVRKIENTYKNKMDVRMINDKTRAIREIIDLALADNAPILITCTTQTQCENLETKLLKVGIDAANIHRFDSTTDRSEKIRLFFKDPKQYLEKHKPRIVILSPTCETGISIDYKNYFQCQYHLHMGNLGIRSLQQFLVRCRDLSVPRIIFCEKQGILNKSNSSSLSEYVKDEFSRKITIDFDYLSELSEKEQVEEIKNFMAAHQKSDDKWHKFAYETAANLNEEMKHLREMTIEALINDGNNVMFDDETLEGCDDIANLMTRVEVGRRVTQSSRLYHSAKISKEEYEVIRNNPNANEFERMLATRYYLTEKQYPGIENTPSWSPEMIQMIKFNKKSLGKELTNYYYLINPELAKINHIANWEPVIATKSIWLPDQITRSQLALIKAALELDLHNLVDQEITNDGIIEFVDKIYNSKRYQTIFSAKIDPKNPPEHLQFFKRIVQNFAFKVKKLSDENYLVETMIDKTLMFKGAPKYELLTPELSNQILQLVGQKISKDSQISKELNKSFKELGIKDPEGSMNTINGAARYLGLSVQPHRERIIDPDDPSKKYKRTYTYIKDRLPISDGIKKSNAYPGTNPIAVKDIYSCIVTKVTNLYNHQVKIINEWKENKSLAIPEITQDKITDERKENKSLTIAEITQEKIDKLKGKIAQEKITDDFENSVLDYELPVGIINNPHFSIENLRDVAQTLLTTAQMKVEEIKEVFNGYLSNIDAMVIHFAGEILKTKYPEMLNKVEPYFAIPF